MRIAKHFSNTNPSSGKWHSELIKSGIYQRKVRPDLLSLTDQEITDTLQKNNDPAVTFFALSHSLLSSRVTESLIKIFKEADPQIIIETSFHHPEECTLMALEVTAKLADAGCILNNRAFLIRDVNDDAGIMRELNHKLLMMRIRPYALFLDEKYGVTPLEGIRIIDALRGWTSGLAVPHLLVKEKDESYRAILPEYIHEQKENGYIFRNYRNDTFPYPEE